MSTEKKAKVLGNINVDLSGWTPPEVPAPKSKRAKQVEQVVTTEERPARGGRKTHPQMKCFTATGSLVEAGLEVGRLEIKKAAMTLPAVLIGEKGLRESRQQAVIVVGEMEQACPHRGEKNARSPYCHACGEKIKNQVHPDSGGVMKRLNFVGLGQTKAGGPKLFCKEEANTADFAVVAVRSPASLNGRSPLSGDRDTSGAEDGKFLPFKGEIITQGVSSRADHYLLVVAKGVVFRVGYPGGTTPGGIKGHYYCFNGSELLCQTWQERMSESGLF